MALSCTQWLERYRARIVHHQPDISRELLDDYATLDTYHAMSEEFPHDPELAVDIDPDLAYVGDSKGAPSASFSRPGRRPEDSPNED